MRSDDTERTLRELLASPVRDAERREELERDLLDRHATITRPGRTYDMTSFLKRPLFAVLLIAVLGIAACTVPTDTEVEMGQRLTYTFSPESPAYAHVVEMMQSVSDMTDVVKTHPGVEDVSVSVKEVDGGPLSIDLMIWGRGISVPSLEDKLSRRWPALALAGLESETLASSVKTSLAENVGHHLFNIEVLEGSPEQMRADILQQIYEGGFVGEADVTVDQDGEMTTIGVELTGVQEGMETEDELVIEIIQEED